MAPVTDKANLEVNPKRTTNDDESDEGFVSPSVQRVGLRNRKDSCHQLRKSECENSSSGSSPNSSDNDSPPTSGSSSSSQALRITDEETETTTKKKDAVKVPTKNNSKEETGGVGHCNGASNVVSSTADAAESKAESLAKFIVYTLLGRVSGDTSDNVERTMLRCVKMMMQRHEILFKGMMKRLQVTEETGYVSFVTVANTLFEDEKMVITWSRIVALYAFGGQLALYCKEKNMEDFACTVAVFMGKYSKEVLTPYVTSIGGWSKICDEFPEESDVENKVRRVLSWTALGLGVAATVSYLTSR